MNLSDGLTTEASSTLVKRVSAQTAQLAINLAGGSQAPGSPLRRTFTTAVLAFNLDASGVPAGKQSATAQVVRRTATVAPLVLNFGSPSAQAPSTLRRSATTSPLVMTLK
jgi:hypothetical protein